MLTWFLETLYAYPQGAVRPQAQSYPPSHPLVISFSRHSFDSCDSCSKNHPSAFSLLSFPAPPSLHTPLLSAVLFFLLFLPDSIRLFPLPSPHNVKKSPPNAQIFPQIALFSAFSAFLYDFSCTIEKKAVTLHRFTNMSSRCGQYCICPCTSIISNRYTHLES